MHLKEMAVWWNVAGVAEVPPRGVPVWAALRSGWLGAWWVVGLRGWRWSGLGGGGLGKWRVMSSEWRVARKSRFLAALGITTSGGWSWNGRAGLGWGGLCGLGGLRRCGGWSGRSRFQASQYLLDEFGARGR